MPMKFRLHADEISNRCRRRCNRLYIKHIQKAIRKAFPTSTYCHFFIFGRETFTRKNLFPDNSFFTYASFLPGGDKYRLTDKTGQEKQRDTAPPNTWFFKFPKRPPPNSRGNKNEKSLSGKIRKIKKSLKTRRISEIYPSLPIFIGAAEGTRTPTP